MVMFQLKNHTFKKFVQYHAITLITVSDYDNCSLSIRAKLNETPCVVNALHLQIEKFEIIRLVWVGFNVTCAFV